MQFQQSGFRLGTGLAQLIPVLILDLQSQGVAHAPAQLIHLRDQQLPLAQVPVAMGLNQLANIHQPELWTLRRGRSLPAGEPQALVAETGQFQLEQTPALGGRQHQCPRFGSQAQRHQQTEPPAFAAAGGELNECCVATPQASCHQPAQGQVVGPVGFFLTEQGFDLVVGLGFQHRQTLSRVPLAIGSWQSIHQHGFTTLRERWRCNRDVWGSLALD